MRLALLRFGWPLELCKPPLDELLVLNARHGQIVLELSFCVVHGAMAKQYFCKNEPGLWELAPGSTQHFDCFRRIVVLGGEGAAKNVARGGILRIERKGPPGGRFRLRVAPTHKRG